jgi:predicted helicase
MNTSAIKKIKDFKTLANFLAEELNWPIDPENIDVDDLTFEYSPEDIGLSEEFATKVKYIKQIRPLDSNQPWSIFWIDFENKKLPLTVLRRILNVFVTKKRGNSINIATRDLEDIMFVSGHGEQVNRAITFAHFKRLDDVETIREFYWDGHETNFDHISNYLEKLKWPTNPNDVEVWRTNWKGAFTGSTREAISNSDQLAKAMANIAKNIKDRVLEVLSVESENGPVHKLFDTFRAGLVHDMTEKGFADMYAQTIAYGLFSARTMDTDGHFELHEVIELIPSTNPFLKSLFKECLKTDDNKDVINLDELGVTNLVDLFDNLNRSDGTDAMQRILAEFGRQTLSGQEDPIIHFYEGFLCEYDNKERVEKGVYYTPDPVVRFIVKSVNEKLKSDYNLEMGLADTTTWAEMVACGKANYPVDPKTNKVNKDQINKLKGRAFVQILDPATGTGTFLKHTIEIIFEEVKAKHKRDKLEIPWNDYWNNYVYNSLLPRIYGFELMMASYSVAHMKIGMYLKSLGYKFEKERRLNIYLTNSLEPYTSNNSIDLFFASIGAEAAGANEIKESRYFTVLIGNPPYNSNGTNNGKWIMDLMRDYKLEPGGKEKLKEKNSKMINDDYMKFIRFGQKCLQKSNIGILCFINPHSYLFNSTFRGVRWNLAKFFDIIEIVDLNGGSRPRLFLTNGSQDENVFDIIQGVSINYMSKLLDSKHKMVEKTQYFNIIESQEEKYKFLNNQTLNSINFDQILIDKKKYIFKPIKGSTDSKYENFISLNDIFIFNSTGMQTDKDDFCIQFKKETISQILNDFHNLDIINFRLKYNLGSDTSSWSLEKAYKDVNSSSKSEVFNKIEAVNFRPFDIRFTLYTGNSNGFMGRPRYDLVKNILQGDNYFLISVKNSRSSEMWNLVWISNIIPTKPTTITTSDANYVFPLYTFSNDIKTHNINLDVLSEFEKRVEINIGELLPLNILDYIYSILHSKKYRLIYSDSLKVDFPKIPYPKNKKSFWKLVELGGQIRNVHLLNSEVFSNFNTNFPIPGDNIVILNQVNYINERVYINKNQYFEYIPLLAWEFNIGGYQPAQKWLKDRKGLELSTADLNHYQKIIVALTETDRLMKEIDQIDFLDDFDEDIQSYITNEFESDYDLNLAAEPGN